MSFGPRTLPRAASRSGPSSDSPSIAVDRCRRAAGPPSRRATRRSGATIAEPAVGARASCSPRSRPPRRPSRSSAPMPSNSPDSALRALSLYSSGRHVQRVRVAERGDHALDRALDQRLVVDVAAGVALGDAAVGVPERLEGRRLVDGRARASAPSGGRATSPRRTARSRRGRRRSPARRSRRRRRDGRVAAGGAGGGDAGRRPDPRSAGASRAVDGRRGRARSVIGVSGYGRTGAGRMRGASVPPVAAKVAGAYRMRYVRTDSQDPRTPSPTPVPSTRTAVSRPTDPSWSGRTLKKPTIAARRAGPAPTSAAPA